MVVAGSYDDVARPELRAAAASIQVKHGAMVKDGRMDYGGG